MSNVLSYNRKSNGEDWFDIHRQYSKDEIDGIVDPSDGLTENPRTAIPSPFAQMDLVKNAFLRLASRPDLHGQLQDEKLVANALDIAQIFFNLHEYKGMLRLVEWNRNIHIEELKASAQHKLLGETIEMYLRQDQKSYNFDRMDKLYFLAYGGRTIGCTSPASLFMATPNARNGEFQIPVEENINLFDQWRPFYERNVSFVKYIYALFNAYPELKEMCASVNAYLIANLRLLSPQVQNEIIQETGNPQGRNYSDVDRARAYLNEHYSQMEGGVGVLGIPLYESKATDFDEAIQHSDFLIKPNPKHKFAEGEQMPLVLQNRLNPSAHDPYVYVTNAWQDTIVIRPSDYAKSPDQRILPSTNHQYPWLTDDDFFQPAMLKLDYPIDKDCFFDGNLMIGRDMDNTHFLLPLKPTFFHYFDMEDLWGTIAGKPRFEIEYSLEGRTKVAKAILRIPVQKTNGFITLTRTYIESASGDLAYNHDTNNGYFITIPFSVAIFPFVRVEGNSQYKVQLVDGANGTYRNAEFSLQFFRNGQSLPIAEDRMRQRTLKQRRSIGTSYYSLTEEFDYINVRLTGDAGNIVCEGVICPLWQADSHGTENYTFAVDFGTTNTHLECIKGDGQPVPLRLKPIGMNRLVATLYNGRNETYDVFVKQEFAPLVLGTDYYFPQRTVLSERERLEPESVDSIIALADANIPFIYEKESVGFGNRIVPNLKWSTDVSTSKRINCYVTELALLMRAKVLLENGNLANTRLVWFYPLSMSVGNVNLFKRVWLKTFQEVFGIPAVEGENVIQMPESVAPYYYYKNSSKFKGAASTVASIDIGGGTSDVVVYSHDSENNLPRIITSFRFAANSLFGDAFSDVPQGDNNPMLQKYLAYFRQLFEADEDKYGEMLGIMDDIAQTRKSEDINAFLFSVADNKVARGNDVFSYNTCLNLDKQRKIIFVYFYVTIIYYVANMMKDKSLEMPREIMFSGTGSKVLNIVGDAGELDLLTQRIIEKVYARKYGMDGFFVTLEREKPKQITCKGALLQSSTSMGCLEVKNLNRELNDFDSQLRCNYSLIAKPLLTYGDMKDPQIRKQIIEAVRQYNDFFISLCEEIRVTDRFLVDPAAWNIFKEEVNRDLEHHLVQGWNYVNKNRQIVSDADPIEDSMFFYPIVGSIRYNLIEKLIG